MQISSSSQHHIHSGGSDSGTKPNMRGSPITSSQDVHRPMDDDHKSLVLQVRTLQGQAWCHRHMRFLALCPWKPWAGYQRVWCCIEVIWCCRCGSACVMV